eukprot:GAHX01001075.1.p1 GENE.GAHX01001075.1~~GAHX01001075.1.p1  ORF type:complete len:457 (+),score=93.94 GAHX01001075.1:1055-2425(+)
MFYFFVIVTTHIFGFTKDTKGPYIIGVIDAGSTKSKLQLYKVTFDKILKIAELPCKDCISRPGLSGFQNNPNQAGPSLDKLLIKFSSVLNEYNQPMDTSELIVSATGGLRSLKDKSVASRILNSVFRYIKQKGIGVARPKIINSTLEGYFALLGIYYAEIANHEQLLDGLIELGGASAQIGIVNKTNIEFGQASVKEKFTHEQVNEIMAVRRKVMALKTDLVDKGMCSNFTPLKLKAPNNGKPNEVLSVHEVFTCGFDGVGAARITEYVREQSESLTYNPCYPKGAELEDSKKGRFNKRACLKIIRNFLNAKRKAFKDNLESIYEIVKLLNGVLKNPLKMYGLSNIKYTAEFFEETKSLTKLHKRVLSYCELDWSSIKELYGWEKDSFLLKYCLDGLYIKELLNNFFKLGDNRSRGVVTTTFEFDDIVGGMETDWTLGNVIYFIHRESRSRKQMNV